MDEYQDIKQALNRHVTTHEPPFTLTAEALLATGRRRGRWRTGITYGAGSVAAMMTITGALTVFNGANQASTLNDCQFPPATGWLLPPSPGFAGWPSGRPVPTGGPVLPTPWPTSPVPTAWPTTPVPTPVPTAWPTSPVPTSPVPTARPTSPGNGGPRLAGQPTPTAPPGDGQSTPTATPGDGQPTPTATPGDGQPTPPMTTPASLPPDVAAATCFLARELRSMLPEARYAPSNDTLFTFDGGLSGYVAQGIIVGKAASTKLIFNIQPQDDPPPKDLHEDLHGWTVREKGGKVIRTGVDDLIQVMVYTGRTHIYLSASGPMLTVDQLERLASAPELAFFD